MAQLHVGSQKLKSCGLLALLLVTGTASAQTVAPPPEAASASAPATTLKSVSVVGRSQFLGADTKGVTNLPLPIEQVPQSISLVSSGFIREANLTTLGDIASYTAGAFNAGNPENNGSIIKIRGFSAGRAIDGINAISSYNAFEPDFAIYDRLEIVEGPSSVVYGISSPGGLVNYVTKSAATNTPSYLSVQGGSWRSYRLEGQIARALDAEERFHVIGVAAVDNGDSFTNNLRHENTVVYGGVNGELSDSLSGFIHAGYERHSRPAFDGIPTFADGTPPPVPRSLLIGSGNIKLNTDVYFATGTVSWTPSPLLDFTLKSNYEKTSLTGGNSYGSGLQDNGDFDFNVTKFDGAQVTQNYGVGATATYKLNDLGVKNSFVSVSALYQQSKQGTNVFYPDNGGTTNIFADQGTISAAFDSLYNGPLPNTYPSDIDTKNYTYAAQASVMPVDKLAILGGVSYSKPEVDTTTLGTPQDFKFSGQTSYRGGITYEILPSSFAYFSYSGSFNPQALIAVDQSVLPPLKGKQYEAGLKARVTGNLLLTGAIYRIVQNNLGEYDQTVDGVDFYKPIGEVTHKGFELKALGTLAKGWQLNAGYALLSTKITADSDPTVVGKRELFLPRNTFSVFSTYSLENFVSGLTVGGGFRYVAGEATSYDGSTKDISGYRLVDLTASYEFGKWKARLNASNIFNQRYFVNNYQTLYYGNVPGQPAQYTLSLSRFF